MRRFKERPEAAEATAAARAREEVADFAADFADLMENHWLRGKLSDEDVLIQIEPWINLLKKAGLKSASEDVGD